jgi:hypothetical protein
MSGSSFAFGVTAQHYRSDICLPEIELNQQSGFDDDVVIEFVRKVPEIAYKVLIAQYSQPRKGQTKEFKKYVGMFSEDKQRMYQLLAAERKRELQSAGARITNLKRSRQYALGQINAEAAISRAEANISPLLKGNQRASALITAIIEDRETTDCTFLHLKEVRYFYPHREIWDSKDSYRDLRHCLRADIAKRGKRELPLGLAPA